MWCDRRHTRTNANDGARALRAACDRRIHARRPLYTASSTHEAGLCSARRWIAEMPSGARRERHDRRIGGSAAIAGRSIRPLHRPGIGVVRIGAYSAIALACVDGFGTTRSVAWHRHISTEENRGVLRPALSDHRPSYVTNADEHAHADQPKIGLSYLSGRLSLM